MPTVHVYLADGFSNDQVVLRVDGRKVFDGTGVTTKRLLGLAKQVSPIEVAASNSRLEVELPRKGLSTTVDVDLSKGTHIPISVEDGRIVLSVEKQLGFA